MEVAFFMLRMSPIAATAGPVSVGSGRFTWVLHRPGTVETTLMELGASAG